MLEVRDIKRGEIYDADLNPIRGSEIRDRRPAIIVSTNAINKSSSVVIVCPITDAFGKDSPVHIPLAAGEGGLKKDSVVHCGQVRSIDKERLGSKYGEVDRYTLAKVGKGLKHALDLNW